MDTTHKGTKMQSYTHTTYLTAETSRYVLVTFLNGKVIARSHAYECDGPALEVIRQGLDTGKLPSELDLYPTHAEAVMALLFESKEV